MQESLSTKEKCTDNLKREREIKDSGEREMEQAHGVGCMELERSPRRLNKALREMSSGASKLQGFEELDPEQNSKAASLP